jgi:hypothetical protein
VPCVERCQVSLPFLFGGEVDGDVVLVRAPDKSCPIEAEQLAGLARLRGAANSSSKVTVRMARSILLCSSPAS